MTTRKTVTETLSANPTQLPSPADVQDQIRRRAFELYEQRGMQDGFAEQDWLEAEAEILGSNAFKAAA